MEAITKIATINVVGSQRARWQSGQLAQEWRTSFPVLFDDEDLRRSRSGFSSSVWTEPARALGRG